MIITLGTKVYDEHENEYEVNEFIGNGSFGYVYKICSTSNGEILALKTLPISFEDQTTLKAFINEGALATGISHKNVIGYVFFHDGLKHENLPPYIIMEYADGGTLEALLNQKRTGAEFLNNNEITQYLAQMIDGIEAINKHLIHRDIKPDNILFSGDTLKITDFGLSKVVDESTRKSTFKGLGCLPYLAPEGWKYETNTIQMDIYSMGFVFFELATLRHPFDQLDLHDMESWRNAHLFENPPEPGSINTNLPVIISQLILKMMEKSAGDRFQNWSEIRNFLRKADLPKTSQTDSVEKLLQRRLEREAKEKEKHLETERAAREKKEFRKLISYRLENAIVDPVKEFIEEFNSKYTGEGLRIHRPSKGIGYFITLSQNERIEIEIRPLFDEDFYRDRVIDDYGHRTKVTQLERPVYEDRKIMAWGHSRGPDGRGFNLILVESVGDIYGEWYIFKNTNSATVANPRLPEPFPFDFSELEKEIKLIKIRHIYKTEVRSFKRDYLIELIEAYI